jgi:hypothetical protein
MTDQSCLDFSRVEIGTDPYLYFSTSAVLRNGLEQEAYRWLDGYKGWKLVTMDFYTQYEFSLFDADIPLEIAALVSNDTIETLKGFFRHTFAVREFELVGVTAHKLVEGHRIGIHNDFLGAEETHRLIIQLNPGWEDSSGGFLMLFRSADSEAVSRIVRPLHNTAFGFAISERSWHAVSRVNDFSRYTLVYTLKAIT